MSDLAGVLTAFQNATQCDAGVWLQPKSGDALPTLDASTEHAPALTSFPSAGDGLRTVATDDGDVIVAAVPGPRRAWLALGPCHTPGIDLRRTRSASKLPGAPPAPWRRR